MRSILCILLLTTATASAGTEYRAIALEGGGRIVLSHGDVARADFVKGDARYTDIKVEGGKLVVENCRRACPRGYEMELAVTARDIDALSVRDGGTIEARGSFPEQPALSAAVSEGGAIDVRAMAARDVAASINSGGGIYTAPRARLTASVSHGGHVAYWGTPDVRRSVNDGGIVAPGRATDAHKPLDEIRPKLAPIPPLPAIPPLPKPAPASGSN